MAGRVRLVLRTPDWEDFVHIACNEIRACGAGSVHIPRRMRAMLEHLICTLPPQRHRALEEQLDLLDRCLPDFYKLPEDLALARVPDSQGLGGASARFAQGQASTDLARVACALERHRLARGQYPESLDPLVPAFIAKLPHDV